MTDSGHFKRQAQQKKIKQRIKRQAYGIAFKALQKDLKNNVLDEQKISDIYRKINLRLNHSFKSFNQYRIARQGFLQAVRDYNQTHNAQLDEPVVPIVEGRDKLTIGYDWFVEGSKVSDSYKTMLDIWQKKRKFSANEYVMYLLYSSIMLGGLNDIDALRALYQWLYGERKLYQINLTSDDHQEESLAVIPLAVQDTRYGCISPNDNELTRYVNYIPDPISLMLLYTLKDIDLNKRKVSQFETLINQLNKQFKLTQRDPNKPHLSHLVKYANFHWRNLPESAIDGAGSMVMQGNLKTTALPTNKLLDYNQEKIVNAESKQGKTLEWRHFFESDAKFDTKTSQPRSSITEYPSFSKNLIKEIQYELKGSKNSAKTQLSHLLAEYPQPNAQRLIQWTLSLLSDGKSNQQSISKYVGSIGRDWLMLTMDESLDDWLEEDYIEVYEQIIQSKISDGRKASLLYKEDEDSDDAIELTDYDLASYGDDAIDTSNLDDSDMGSIEPHKDARNSEPTTKTFTSGRLQAFHNFQMHAYGAPCVPFAWQVQKQVVEANMVSPRVYHCMQNYLKLAKLTEDQRQLCQTVVALAYRTGMRLNELIGIKVADIEDINNPSIILKPNRYRRLKSSSARRRLPIACLLKRNELESFQKLYEQQKTAKRRYLFSSGIEDNPLPSYFFTNLLTRLWDLALGRDNHNYTFHSMRHTAISQLGLVVSKSPLTYVMTDYDNEDAKRICKALLGYHQMQGAWFGLASFVGHLTCDTTFEHYIHTAHLIAGQQLSQAQVFMPLITLTNITDIEYQRINYHDKTAYDKTNKTVSLTKLRSYFGKKLKAHHAPLFQTNQEINKQSLNLQSMELKADTLPQSIFIHAKYNDVIAYLLELNAVEVTQRRERLEQIAIKHGIYFKDAQRIYANAERLHNDQRLIIQPRGRKAQIVINKALDRAYHLSIRDPDTLHRLVAIYQQKHITSNSYLHFGIKKSQHQLLAEFMTLACQLVDAQHWQIRSDSEQAVRDLKKKYRLNSKIMTGVRPKFKGFEVRVVDKAKDSKTGDGYYKSSGVLKFVGGVLVCLVDLTFIA